MGEDMRFGIVSLCILVMATAAHAQEERKATITVSNGRSEPLVMRFDYAFRDRTWNLMERPVPVGQDLTYRYPTHIPGCEKLHEWGVADGILTVSNSEGALCRKRVSLCDANVVFMDVGRDKCFWRETREDGTVVTPTSEP
jgi:hypothetical protein